MLACMLFSFIWSAPVYAEETAPSQPEAAVDITDISLVSDSVGFSHLSWAFDGKASLATSAATASMTLSYAVGIGSLYLQFSKEYGTYTLVNNDTGAEHSCGEYSFLHEYLDLTTIFGSAPSSVTLRFENGTVRLMNIYAFLPVKRRILSRNGCRRRKERQIWFCFPPTEMSSSCSSPDFCPTMPMPRAIPYKWSI